MGSKNVDIVFVLDASDSMAPCFGNVVKNIETMLKQLRQAAFNIRLDVLLHNVPSELIYWNRSMFNANVSSVLYHKKQGAKFFTSDVNQFCEVLERVEVGGEEDMLTALDLALDFPFGPVSSTQRVVILLSDEPFDTNYQFEQKRSIRKEKIPDMIDKIHARKIALFMAMPECDFANELAEADRSDFVPLQDARSGLKNFDFKQFFSQLGKTISVSVAQMTRESDYKKALFGQDQWGVASGYQKGIEDVD